MSSQNLRMEGEHKKTMKSDSMAKKKEVGTSRPLKRGGSSRFPMQLLFYMIGSFHSMGCDNFSRRAGVTFHPAILLVQRID
jgi:hypothetical protein